MSRAEFASVVDAVRCAEEVQHGMFDREPEVPDERRIRFLALAGALDRAVCSASLTWPIGGGFSDFGSSK